MQFGLITMINLVVLFPYKTNPAIPLVDPLKGTPSFLLFRPNGEMAAQQAGTVVISELEKFIADNS